MSETETPVRGPVKGALGQMGITVSVVETPLPESQSTPNVQFPTLLTSFPVFKPTNNRSKADTKGMVGEEFKTSWGKVERHGPGLNIYDQDTLIAIIKLGQRKEIVGPKSELLIGELSGPIPPLNGEIVTHQEQENETVVIHAGSVSARQINKFLDRDESDGNLALTRESIKRLSLQNLIFYTDKMDDPRYSGKERKVEFFKYHGDRDLKGVIDIVFPPPMVLLLRDYALIDVEQRKKLSAVGKCVQLHLAGLPRSATLVLEELMATVGASNLTEFKRALLGRKNRIGQLELMVEAKFLKSYKVSGNGKSEPYVLEFTKN